MSPSFTRVFLLLFSGPIIWAGHFLFVYGFTGLVCARPLLQATWVGISVSTWVIATASTVSIIFIGLVHLRMRKSSSTAGDPTFMPLLTTTLGLFSVLAILWETLPVMLVPSCA